LRAPGMFQMSDRKVNRPLPATLLSPLIMRADFLICTSLVLGPMARFNRLSAQRICALSNERNIDWEEEPWEEVAQPAGGVLLQVEETGTGLQVINSELAALTQSDCTALLQSADLSDAQLSLTLCDDASIQGVCRLRPAQLGLTPRPCAARARAERALEEQRRADGCPVVSPR